MTKKLDVIQAKALRTCSGAFSTIPIPAFGIEMGEKPLKLRRCKVGLKYLMKVKGQDEQEPVKAVWLQHWEFPSTAKTSRINFGEHLKDVAKEARLDELDVRSPVCWSAVPLWLGPDPIVDLDLLKRGRVKSGEAVQTKA